ncbi:phasin family protein [uncultured Thiocystis sp.]|jgi:phasin family protein|uniref:phasin family protein n=1 Tax=uncultured Thiocystis sp. TaxID=1202134 RepID=UPI0025CDCEB3|nr:phasin family protein [uncultured Thiocystis sp.]
MNTTDTLNTVNEIASKSVERLTSLGELNVRIFEKMAARQMDALTLYMDHVTRVTKLATEAKGYNEFFQGQVDATKELSERVMAESKTTMQLVSEARDDYRAWLEKNTAELTADLQKNTAAA